MFTCIACTKQTDDEGEDGAARGSGTPSTKEAVKSLTTQIKDMALKFSGAYRQCKPCTGSSSYKKGQRPYPDFDTASEGVPYPYIGGASASSTPAWDFPPVNRHPHTRSDSRFKGVFRGDQTPGADSTISACDVVLEDEDEPKEWMAQVEPGVHITFVSLPNGGNDLKRIRFDREMFNKWQAQRWWGENYDRITELYNVQRFNQQALHTPPRTEDERDSSYSKMERDSPMTAANKDWALKNHKPSGSKGYFPSDQHFDHGSSHHYAGSSAYPTGGAKGDMSSMEVSRTTTSSRDEPSISVSNASDIEAEWVEEDEPGVYITIRQLVDGSRELRRVRFSRERFGEVNAKQWWEQNRERIQAQYL
ncbi:protein BREVIS RADIX-like [Cucurbita moschata]|uniref:Protein BREVIS RADIX-like n=1 Tax=Cucurbita moschata TaxID=3662 RepID=A0A6J1G178_CUCMO|nr:protein BREVIS RADIX-like [Cucurbita moschata]